MFNLVVEYFLKISSNLEQSQEANIKQMHCLKPMFEIYNLDFSHIMEKSKPKMDMFTFILIDKLKEVFTKIVPTPSPGIVSADTIKSTRIYMIEFLITVCVWINNVKDNLIQNCYLNSISYEEIEGITQFSYNKYKNNQVVMNLFQEWKIVYLQIRKESNQQSSQTPKVVELDELFQQIQIEKSDYDNYVKKKTEEKVIAQASQKQVSQPKKGKDNNTPGSNPADRMKHYGNNNIEVNLNSKNQKPNEQQDFKTEGNPNDNTESQDCDFSQSEQQVKDNNGFQQNFKFSPTLLLEQQNQAKPTSNKPQFGFPHEKHKPNLGNSQDYITDGYQKNDLNSIEEAQESLFQRNIEVNYPQQKNEQLLSWNVLASFGEKDASKPKYFQNSFAIFRNAFLELGTQIKVKSIESFNCVYCKLYIKNSTLTDFKGVSFGLSEPTYQTTRVEFDRAQFMVGKGKQEQVKLAIRNSGYPILPITVKLQIEDTPIKHFVVPNSILSYITIVENPSEVIQKWMKTANTRNININSMNQSIFQDPSFKELLNKMKTEIIGKKIKYKGIFELQLLKKLFPGNGKFNGKQQQNTPQEYKLKFTLKFENNDNKKLTIKVSDFYDDYDPIFEKSTNEFRNMFLDLQVLQGNIVQALSYVFEQQKIIEGQEL